MNIRQYIEYIIVTLSNFTCTNLADHLEGQNAISHDAVSDLLASKRITPRYVWEAVAPYIDDSPESYLIVDDSVQDKRYSKKIGLVKRQYSGAVPGLVRGICVVNLMHTNGQAGDYWPIDFRIYDKIGDGKTKNDHFREMLTLAKSDKQIKARTVLFDSWYASVDNLKLIQRLDMFFVTTLKSNRKVSLSKETGYVHLQDIVWTELQLSVGIEVKLEDLPTLVRLFKIVPTNGDVEWLITNRKDVPSDEDPSSQSPITDVGVQKVNAVRWKIEQMHRELKQNVGTEKCQCRKARSQRNHMACCYLAWLALKVNALGNGKTIYKTKADLWSDYLRRLLRNPQIAVVGIA
jgi:hypothetical protein